MNFDELDAKMRRFEQSLDQIILPELYLTVRLDGRNFTRLTKEICKFEAPFPGCHDRYRKAPDAVWFQDRLRLYGER